jgi:hypothetical protein
VKGRRVGGKGGGRVQGWYEGMSCQHGTWVAMGTPHFFSSADLTLSSHSKV